MTNPDPEFLLFAQHGWADDNKAMGRLAEQLVQDEAKPLVITPCLDYMQTWIRMAPLIDQVEAIAAIYMADYPNVPLRIVGHSMGGLIWLEVLNRHPRWRDRVHSFVLVGSPVGGADLGRLIDPLKLGLGIASDLGINRKPIAESLAAELPMLIIAGDLNIGTDGTVPVECTRFANARFVALEGISHADLRFHPRVASTIRDFWQDFNIGESIEFDEVVRRLHAVPGITDGHWRDFEKAQPKIQLKNGGTIRVWKNLAGIDHVFVASPEGRCLYAGFVGWLHAADLANALNEIEHTSLAESP
ncbi:alpha/beta fold hydrolase [Leptolyngbya sp. AN02str]|uniref:alpha/beta fold hydrolase n=1 Tax=Leptolyngbya sp. AN02str TaxID=3423363 RepID=UPI003D314E43